MAAVNPTADDAVIEFEKCEEVNSRTFIHQTESGSIFFRNGVLLWSRNDDQKAKTKLEGCSEFSIMSAQGEAIYYGSNWERKIFKAHLTGSGIIQCSMFRQMLEGENLHQGGVCSVVLGDNVHIHKMSDALKNGLLNEPIDASKEYLKVMELQCLHGNLAIFKQLVYEDVQPELNTPKGVSPEKEKGISLTCTRGVKKRYKDKDLILSNREFYAPWGSPAVVKSDYVYMTNGKSLFVIDPVGKKLLPPLQFSNVSAFHIAGIHNGTITGRGKCDKSGKYHLMTAQLPSEYVSKPAVDPLEKEPKSGTFSSEFYKKFTVESIIGQGGYGCVFKVVDVHDNCEYAVKRIAVPPVKRLKEDALKEGQVLAKLKHPGIVGYNGMWVEEPPEGWQHTRDDALRKKMNYTERLRSFNSDSIFIYIKLQLCDISLHDWLDDNPDQSSRTFEDKDNKVVPEIKQWFKEMVSAVEYLHETMFHRDLKPSNILLAAEGDKKAVKICDLGIAAMLKDEDNKTKSAAQTFVGTHAYMSPEQLNRRPYSSPTDVFSLGLILAEMCLAMSDAERNEIFDNYRQGQQCDRIENPITKEFIALLTQVNPEDRPTCKEMQNHLFIA